MKTKRAGVNVKTRKDVQDSVDKRRQRVSELHCGMKTQHEIAEILGVSQVCVSQDIAFLREEWKKNSQISMTDRLAMELAQLDHIKRLATEGWNRSCENSETTVVKRVPVQIKRSKSDSGPVKAAKKKLMMAVSEEKTTKCQSGNPAYLGVIKECISSECKLLGLLDERAVNINNNTAAIADFSALFARKDDPQLAEKRTPILPPVDDQLENDLKQLESQAGIQREVT